MPKIRILGSVDDQARAALIELLREAGFKVIEDDCEEISLISEEEEDVEASPVGDELQTAASNQKDESISGSVEEACVVVLTPDCSDNPEFAEQMRDAASRGCRVIGVWPPGATSDQPPRAVEDYGAGTVPWDMGRLRDALNPANANPTWSLPNGQPRQQPKVKRNRC